MKNNASKQTDTQAAPIKLYSTHEVAKLWNISYWTVRALVLDGTIKPIVGLGKGWKFSGFELREEMLERL